MEYLPFPIDPEMTLLQVIGWTSLSIAVVTFVKIALGQAVQMTLFGRTPSREAEVREISVAGFFYVVGISLAYIGMYI